MSLQPKFRKFHQTIKLDRFDQNATLREKRDRVLSRLRENCSRSFTSFNQGSYEMGTGVVPLKGDYDIDVGVVFDLGNVASHDSVAVKQWVYDAVSSHTTRVEFRRPCITVYYQRSGEAVYHVDLAVYGQDRYGQLHIAMGKQHSAAGQRQWVQSDPEGLTSQLRGRWAGEDGNQFRRVVRYLKRWKDLHFPATGNAAPVGIGLTIASNERFHPTKAGSWNSQEYDDLAALRRVVDGTRGAFQRRWVHGSYVDRLVARVPASPRDDVFERMTDQQMQEFKQRLDTLSGQLAEAASYGSTQPLVRAFGSDFPTY